ncbi:MAG: DNA topoisomerase IV subunit A [Beijerinckiaceae bacterium]
MDETTKPPGEGPGNGIENVSLKSALEERYLAYALSTIMHRALPDARDGLKPVQRRILYAMRLLKLDPTSAFKKCASVVGEVIGKYHPHGDQSIYDAMVRLAQDFAQRYMLVDGQGNFGSIDGDNAAAYRYTEAKLTEVGALLLQGIDEDAVDFRATYNNENDEPVVLPGAFPNMLANGTTGIAVGMATSIPPHNAAELCDAALYLIEHPKATSDQLITFVPGPDLPTGGIIVESRASITETYRTGRGGFRIRARWHKEETGRGTYIIVVTEIPYLVQKGRLIETLADLINEKKVPILGDVRDESAEDIRLVIEPKTRLVDENVLMETLFKLTELETRFSMNMNVLVDGMVPRVIGLCEALQIWLDHRRVVLQRRSRFRLGEIERRLERLGGLLIAFLNLDEVIRIIREEDEPKPALIRRFELTDLQAETILDTRLRQLRKLEEMELRKEFDKLTEEKGQIEELLGDTAKQWKTIDWEIRAVKKAFGPETTIGKRRTTFADMPTGMAAIDLSEALVEREPITVVLSDKGWIRALKGHVSDLTSLTFKADDTLRFWFHTETTAKLLMLVSNGKVFTLEASKLPGGRGFGDPVRLMADIDEDAGIISLWPHQAGTRLLMIATGDHDVRGFVALSDELVANTRKGKNVLTVDGKWKAVLAVPAMGDSVAIIGENRKLIVYPLAEVPEMTRGKGVRLQKYKDGNVADAKVFSMADGLTWLSSDGRKYTVARPELDEWIGKRAEAGKLPPKGFPKGNRFVG